MGDENPIRTLGDYSKPSHEGYMNIIELPVGNNVDLALHDNESWNGLRDFAKPVKAIVLPQDAPSTSDRHLIKLEFQVQCLMETYLALTQPTQVNKVTTSCEICSGPHDTQYCMKDNKQAFVEYASLRTDEVGGNSMAPKSIATISQVEREELKKKGIKRPSKLFSLKYLSPASIKELNKNSSVPKRVYFVNSIVVLSKDSDTKEEDVSSTNTRKHDLEVWGTRLWKAIHRRNRPRLQQGRRAITLSMDNKKITFKMPHTMEIFKQTRLMGLSTDSIPSPAYERNFGHGRTHYHQSLLIGDEYKHEGGERRGIRHLIRLEKEVMGGKDEVTLYLMRKSLEVLRKFQWTILRGRFNQLLHISSPLLSKPGEY
ncbi:hypothetical protein Tco_0381019 [Tanacetum coccineum]